MRIRFKNGNMTAFAGCYIEDGNPNPAGAGGSPPATGNPSENNTGGADPLASFWNDPAAPPANPANPPPASPPASGNPPAAGPSPFADVQAMITGFKPEPFMNASVVNEMGENKFDGFNAGLEAHGKALLEQSASMTAGILKTVLPQIMQQMQTLVDSKFTSTDNTKFLQDNIPQYKNPALAKQVTDVFGQAMKHSNNDKEKALAMTKSMLAAMGTAFAPPVNPNDPRPLPGPKTDWYAELGGIIQE